MSKLSLREPRTVLNYLRYKATPHFLLGSGPARREMGGVVFDCDIAADRNYRRMYFGTYETDTLRIMRDVLRPGDTFVDVGANVGYISAIAASLVGTTGQVHSFEPVPRYFDALTRMAEANPGYSISVNRMALGEEAGTTTIDVTNLDNMGWNTMVQGLMSRETIDETVPTPVARLDEYLFAHQLDDIALVKIDVEGYELPVLRGLSGFLDKTERRPPILCEVAPAAYPLLGSSLGELAETMSRHGYQARRVKNPRKPLDLTALVKTTDVLFS